MNKAIATFALVAAAALYASAADDATFAVRAVSYNVRYKTSDDTGVRAWDARKAALCNFVKGMDPDVIGFQEVDPLQMTDLKSLLPDYEIFGKHREADNTQRGTPVAYRKSRFMLLDGGTFWLSTTPDKQGSKSLPDRYTGTCPETCSWALLLDRRTRGAFCFFNTHLDHKQAECRKRQMAIAVARTMQYADAGVPAVFVGDLNCYESTYPSDHFALMADLRIPCANDLYTGKVRVEIDKKIPYAGYGRFVLTQGANLVSDENLEFVLPEWVERAAVENGEIVIYTKPEPLKVILR